MGKMQRRKGLVNEYMVRDLFRDMGYEADRVPSSGAADGFKGDIRVTDSARRTLLIECKHYKEAFKRLYEALELAQKDPIYMEYEDMTAYLSYRFQDMPLPDWNGFKSYPFRKSKPLAKVRNMFNLLKECDLLVVRNDHKKPIFIKYWVKQ